MSTRRSGGAAGAAAVLALLAAASSARADEKQVCALASEDAQQLRTEGRPKEARERLLVCVRDACPQIVRKDCTLWLAEVTAALPSVVVGARDAQGQDIVNVRVTLDGKPFTDKVDGKAIAVNPGVHTFHYEMDGAPPVEERVVIREGEKNRELVVTFKTPVPTVAPPQVPAKVPGSAEPLPPPAASHGPPVLTYVFGGLAVVAAGGYAYFGIKGKNDVDGLRSSCAPSCSEAQKDNASTELLVANVSFGVGVAALATAVILWIAQPGAATGKASAAAGTSPAPALDVRPLPGGGVASLGGRF
jgi:hypothetical protein